MQKYVGIRRKINVDNTDKQDSNSKSELHELGLIRV